MSVSTQQVFLSTVPIKQVTIYHENDNIAEIQRDVPVSLAAGLNEILIENLPVHLVQSSLRISGSGAATIHDVTVKYRHGVKFQLPERVQKLEDAMKEKEEIREKIKDRKNIVSTKISSLDKLIAESVGALKSKDSFVFNPETVEQLDNLDEYYSKKSEKLREEARKIQKDLQNAEQEYNLAVDAFNSCGFGHISSQAYGVVVLEAEENTEIHLEMKYQTYNVRWSPVYDVRVKTGAEPELDITYSGQISQSSGEEWDNVPLILSTASPQVGGELPKLGTLEVSVKKPYNRDSDDDMGFACEESAPVMMCALGRAPRAMKNSVAQVRNNTISTEFVISRPASIQNQTENFKVTIGVISLKPKLSYSTVPSKRAAAFLVVNAINDSKYPLIAGQASIFLDGTFINKIHINTVVVNAKLTASLSIDPSIKITYKPVKKYQEQIGIITKSNANAVEKTIIVANHREDEVLLTIHEHVPRSTDERIKVQLQKPVAAQHGVEGEQVKEGAILNKDNILEYTVKLKAREEKTFVVKYTIEHPKTEEITFDEKF